MITTYGVDGKPRTGEHDLHVVLVHADRGGEDTGADVADARHLEESLDGAVLTPRSVQQWEHDVDLAELVRRLAGLGDGDLTARRVLADDDGS